MPNVIKQIVSENGYGQTIKMVVRDNERGPQGEKGDTGEAASISAGNAYSVNYGEQPQVINTGSSTNAVFDFYIPKGENGSSATVQVGETVTLPAGCPAVVTNVGDEHNAVLNFDIPKGDTGATGPAGPRGPQGIQGVPGKDGAIQYTAGAGIEITENNEIRATGAATAMWGDIEGTLSNQSDLQSALNAKQNTLTAGTNITINNGTISATDTTYTAGNAITIDSANNNQINAAIEPANFFTAGENTQASGSSITVSNSANLPIKDVQLDGNTFQQTYSGKNLCYDIQLPTTNSIKFFFPKTLSSSTITISTALNVATAANTVSLWVDGNNIDNIGTFSGNAGETISRTFTFTDSQMTTIQSGSEAYLQLYKSNAGFTLPTWAQIETGSTATAYEPYVGGIAAPNPDYPQEIHTVTGEQTINVTGKNIFGATLEQGVLSSSNGSEFDSAARIRTDGYINVNENTMYSYSTGTSGLQVCVFYYQSDGTYLNFSDWQNLPAGITTVANTGKIKICYRKSSQDNITPSEVSNVQVELGPTATAYEPHQSQNYKVNLGKNLLNSITWRTVTTAGGYPIADLSAATITSSDLNDVSFDVAPAGYGGAESDFIKVSAGQTFTVSFSGDTLPNRFYVTQYNNSKTRVSTLNSNTASVATTTVTTSQDGYLTICFGNTTTGSFEIEDIQLELGSAATTYAPYFTPIELCKIGNYQDYIYDNGGNWYVHKVTTSVTLDGSQDEDWAISGTGTANYFYRFASLTGLKYEGITENFICDQGTPASIGSTTTEQGCSVTNAAQFRIRYGAELTLTNWKNKLAALPMSVYYVLTTPTDTQITDATLIGQLNALKSAQTYDGVTYITATSTSPNLPAILGITAFNKSLAGTLEALIENSFTAADQAKLAGIEAGAEVNVQADWNQATATADDYIKNKPTVPTITMTNTDPGEGSALAANNFIAVYGSDPLDYSTSETSTGLKWIDGNTIYKKTVYVSSLPNNLPNIPTAHGISNLAQLVNVEAIATTSNGTMLPLPFVSSTSSLLISYSIDDTNIIISTGADRSGTSAYFTLYYTKSS